MHAEIRQKSKGGKKTSGKWGYKWRLDQENKNTEQAPDNYNQHDEISKITHHKVSKLRHILDSRQTSSCLKRALISGYATLAAGRKDLLEEKRKQNSEDYNLSS